MALTKQQKILKEELFKKGLKQCPRCPEPKTFSEFGKDKHAKYGLRSWCKEHMNEGYERNKEEITQKRKEFCNKPETKAKRKEYRDQNKIKKAKYDKEYHENPKNKEKILKKAKKYRDSHREEINRKAKVYHDNPEVKTRINMRQNARRKVDINFKISSNLRSRICNALENNAKSKSTMELVGCSVEELKIYLENQFTKGMSWENHELDGWHIDHIKPCAKFDLTYPKQQEICFHYTNLQPLWAIDNLKKSNKY